MADFPSAIHYVSYSLDIVLLSEASSSVQIHVVAFQEVNDFTESLKKNGFLGI